VIGLYQGRFGGVRSFAGGGEADCCADAADSVQVAIGFRNMFDGPVVAARYVIGRDDRVPDFVLERCCEAMPYPGNAHFKLVDVHGVLPWFLGSKHPRQNLRAGQVS